MSAPFQALSNGFYAIPKAQILFKPAGQAYFELLGDTDEATLEIAIEETERYTNEEGIRVLARTIITQVDATFNTTLVQLSDRNRALSILGLPAAFTQAAAVGNTLSVTGVVAAGAIYELNGEKFIDPGTIVVTDGTTLVPYVNGVDFELDDLSGKIQINSIPGGADADLEVTYDLLEIVAADGINEIGLASETENRGTLIIRGTNDVGPRVQLELWDVQLRPDGERAYISESELDTIEITGRVYRDSTKAAGYELGRETLLANESA